MTIAVVATVMIVGGLIAGMIAYSKNRHNSTFVAFFVLGALFPLIGIIVAALTKGPQAVPPSWQPDPWQQATYRWWDGTGWSGHTA